MFEAGWESIGGAGSPAASLSGEEGERSGLGRFTPVTEPLRCFDRCRMIPDGDGRGMLPSVRPIVELEGDRPYSPMVQRAGCRRGRQKRTSG